MRVHELAKELNISSKEVIAKLTELGLEAKNHMSTVDEESCDLVRLSLDSSESATQAETVIEKAPEPATAPEAAVPEAKAEEGSTEEETASDSSDQDEEDAGVDGNTLFVKGAVVVKELAELLKLKPNQLIAELMKLNIFASINERLDFNIAKKIAEQHGKNLEHAKKSSDHKAPKAWEEDLTVTEDAPEDLKPRPPVVAFLGHVDHGKTSLLDRIRDAMVASGEAGGITQHIGAYTVEINGNKITFLDTPGHAAFTAMRARGANLTDIAVLIVAADDGIMPQTKEAISHIQAAESTLMVAINKMDLPGANPDQVKQQLQSENLTPEDWGGETICCEVSAQTGDGIDHLLEMIALQAEVLDLRANPSKKAMGYVIESKLETGMGPTANLLIKEGTLNVGDVVLCGPCFGKVKALIDDRGQKVKSAGPSMAVKCMGLSGVPDAGADFRVYANEKAARLVAQQREEDLRTEKVAVPVQNTLDSMFAQLASDEKRVLKLVLKADVQGSLEAIRHTLQSIPTEKIEMNILLASVGNITVNDVLLASASDAIVVGFNVAKENGVNAAAKHEGVEIRLHSVIYELTDEIRRSMTGMLAPETTESITGHARVQQVFPISKLGTIAGCISLDGIITSKSKARVLRDNESLYEGSIANLRRFQNDVSEVRESQECGIMLNNFGDFKDGDILEFYVLQKVEVTL